MDAPCRAAGWRRYHAGGAARGGTLPPPGEGGGEADRGGRSVMDDTRQLLRHTADVAASFLDELDDRPVGRPVPVEALRATLGGPLPERPTEPAAVIDALAAGVDSGLV